MQEGNPIKTVGQLADSALYEASKKFGTSSWWRGQPCDDPSCSLRPRVFRDGWNPGREGQLILRFMRQARIRHPNCPGRDKESHPSWLILMQHYGLPTRLLDWTESALVGLYFAVEGHPKHTGALFALSPYRLNEAMAPTEGRIILDQGSPPVLHLVDEAFAKTPKLKELCYALYPEETDPRIQLQSSTFTVHGSPTPLEQGEKNEDYLLRFLVPPKAKIVIARQLERCGIMRSTLFPDLENLARDLDRADKAQANGGRPEIPPKPERGK